MRTKTRFSTDRITKLVPGLREADPLGTFKGHHPKGGVGAPPLIDPDLAGAAADPQRTRGEQVKTLDLG